MSTASNVSSINKRSGTDGLKLYSPFLQGAVAFILIALVFVPSAAWNWMLSSHAAVLLTSNSFGVAQAVGLSVTMLLVWFSYKSQVRHNSTSRLLWLALLLYIAADIIGCSNSFARSKCILITLTVGLGLLAARLCDTTKRIAVALSLFGAAQAVYAFLLFVTRSGVVISGTVFRAVGSLNDPNYLAIVMVMCLPLALVLAMQENNPILTAVWMMGAAVMFAALILTASRASMLATASSLTWLAWRLSKRWTGVAVATLVLVALSSFIVIKRGNGEVNEASAKLSTQLHSQSMHRDWEIFEHNWLTGVGVGSLEASSNSMNQQHSNPDTNSKNIILHWLAELGIAGGILLLLFVVSISRLVQQVSTPLATGIGAAWIGLFFSGLFHSPFGLSNQAINNAFVGTLLGATLLLPTSEKVHVEGVIT